MVDIKPDRTNWRQFCEEPRLSDEEYAEWQEMASAILEAESGGMARCLTLSLERQ